MDNKEFIYHFTKIFLSEAVRETILIENWVEKKDFDPRYEEYAKSFMAMKLKYATEEATVSDFRNELEGYRNKLVENFNKKLLFLFTKEITRHGCDKKFAASLIPENIFFRDTININVLKSFRELEEKY